MFGMVECRNYLLVPCLISLNIYIYIVERERESDQATAPEIQWVYLNMGNLSRMVFLYANIMMSECFLLVSFWANPYGAGLITDSILFLQSAPPHLSVCLCSPIHQLHIYNEPNATSHVTIQLTW